MTHDKARHQHELAARAIEVRHHAYAPYSLFPVGAALRTKSGKVLVGCNVENASFGLTICAERAAADMNMAFLGAIPLVMSIREGSDAGQPPVAAAPDGPEARAYRAIAQRILETMPKLRS